MTKQLNELECRLLDYIEERLSEDADIPSYEEIRSELQLSSKDHVSRLLDTLEDKAFIQRRRGRSRSLMLIRTSDGRGYFLGRTVRIPLLAVAAASFDQDPYDGFEPESYIELTRDLVPDETGIYALQVRGDSMIDAMISDGDIVVLRQQEIAHNGDLVQVWVNSEESATLKRFYHEKGKIKLQPENPTMQPRYFPPHDIQIQGKVVLVIRQLEQQIAA